MNKYVSPVAEEVKFSLVDVILASPGSSDDCAKDFTASEDTGATGKQGVNPQSLV